MSLSLRIGTENLDLRDGTAVEFTLTSPIFDKDDVSRLFTMPFRLPKSPRNVSLLGNINRFDSAAPYVFDDVQLLIDEGLFEGGELVSTGSDEEDLEVVFRTKPISILEDADKININTILEKINAGSTGIGGYWKYEMLNFPSTYFIGFDLPSVGATYTPSVGTTLDIATFQFASQINNAVPGIVVGASAGVITLSAKLVNQRPVFQTVSLEMIEFKSEGDQDQAEMTDFVNNVVTNDDDRLTFPMVRWEEAYGGKVTDFRDLVNPVTNGELVQNPDYNKDENWRRTIVPMVRWPYVMRQIAAELDGLEYAGTVWENSDIQQLILINNYSLDHVCADRHPRDGFPLLSSEEFFYLNGYVQEIDLNDHVPSMTAAAFWKAFTGSFCLWMQMTKGTLIFRRKRDMVIQVPVDWSAYVAPTYSDVITENKGYTLDYTDRKEDKYVPIGAATLESYVSGAGKEVTNIPISSVQMDNTASDGTGGLVRIPCTRQRLESAYLGGKPNQYPLAFLFHRGLQLSDVGISYSYATNDEKSRTGSTIGQYSLNWKGAKGLYAQWWKGIAGLAGLREVKIPAVVPIGELFRIRRWENARLAFFHPNGSVVVVIKTVQFSYLVDNRTGFVPVTLTAVITLSS